MSRGKHQQKAAKRRAALNAAAEDAATVAAVTGPTKRSNAPAVPPSRAARPAEAPAAAPPSERRRQTVPWAILGVAAAALLGIGIFIGLALHEPAPQAETAASPGIEVGVPGGEVISQAPPTPTVHVTPAATPTVAPTIAPTPAPTVAPAPTPTPVATTAPQPTVAPTASPPPATPAPTAIVVAAGQPGEAVTAFYRSVAAGDFEAAYSLWSGRMKATYPREENLDGRFGETAGITFQQLFVAEQTDRTATVQANFTETYDGGGSREFIGYWRLVLVDGRWLLDEPHY